MNEMTSNADLAAELLKGLASPHRLLILCQLVTGEKSVGALIEATGLAPTSMSQHLAKLKQAQLVTFRRNHRTLYYRLDNPAAADIMDVLYQHYCNNKGEIT